uniref:Uncharacterized protein n=1 Tax=viral metagenome TaxID=1070528 RepID=A0A6C0LJ31_9ZZZZ
MKKLPFIVIFDIDHAIIGTVSTVVKEWEVITAIYNICKKKGINAKCPSMDFQDFQDELKNGLLRPYVSDFLSFCNTKFKNTEIFLYTNSSYRWTNGGLGKNIEKALKMKINRPFFTRENSLWMGKSLANTYPIMMKSLVKRYPLLKDENVSEYVLHNRTVFIDDIADNIIQYKSRQLVCPKYNFWNEYDIYDRFITTYKIDPQVFNDKDILDLLHKNGILVYNANGNEYQKNKEYIAIAKTYHAIHNEIERSQDNKKDDRYFKDLTKELSNKKISDDCLTDKNIAMLNGKLLK